MRQTGNHPRRQRKAALASLFALLVLFAAACSAVPAQIERVRPTPALVEGSLPRSMKGYELYSWQADGRWFFTLITGTNRSKTWQEIASGEDVLTGEGWVKLTAEGVDGIRAILSRLPAGESVFWLGGAGIGPAPSADSLALPPEEMVAAVREHARELGLDLHASPAAQAQRLRITNQGGFPLQNLVVVFPEDRIEFGDVLPGTNTDYQAVPHGVYRYAAYSVEVEGQVYDQPVIDWVGENPMPGDAFTYLLEADPSRWEAEGQVIRLVEVIED